MTDTNLYRAAKMAGVSKYYGKKADPLAVSSIRAHAATLDELDAAKAELEAFKREVSDKAAKAISIAMKADTAQALFDVDDYKACAEGLRAILSSFILPKPDPLVEVVKACGYATLDAIEPEFVADLNSTAERLGYRLKLERIEHE